MSGWKIRGEILVRQPCCIRDKADRVIVTRYGEYLQLLLKIPGSLELTIGLIRDSSVTTKLIDNLNQELFLTIPAGIFRR